MHSKSCSTLSLHVYADDLSKRRKTGVGPLTRVDVVVTTYGVLQSKEICVCDHVSTRPPLESLFELQILRLVCGLFVICSQSQTVAEESECDEGSKDKENENSNSNSNSNGGCYGHPDAHEDDDDLFDANRNRGGKKAKSKSSKDKGVDKVTHKRNQFMNPCAVPSVSSSITAVDQSTNNRHSTGNGTCCAWIKSRPNDAPRKQ